MSIIEKTIGNFFIIGGPFVIPVIITFSISISQSDFEVNRRLSGIGGGNTISFNPSTGASINIVIGGSGSER
jgi:hypothetical protein